GTAFLAYFQAGIVKDGQRALWNSGCASMGYELPLSIGVSYAAKGKDVVCIGGEGSMQMNLQELETIIYNKLPIKIFYINNAGYISIKQTQDSFFNGRRYGCDSDTGVGFPDIIKIAKAYGFNTYTLRDQKGLEGKIMKILAKKGPLLCEVELVRDYKFMPKLSSEAKPDGRIVSKPPEDLYPFLDREEFKKHMIIPMIEE
ncbi:MAG: thiamine pyrophosphate-dependent enzyme, partial [Candidatus Firestonebacteria bacterium]